MVFFSMSLKSWSVSLYHNTYLFCPTCHFVHLLSGFHRLTALKCGPSLRKCPKYPFVFFPSTFSDRAAALSMMRQHRDSGEPTFPLPLTSPSLGPDALQGPKKTTFLLGKERQRPRECDARRGNRCRRSGSQSQGSGNPWRAGSRGATIGPHPLPIDRDSVKIQKTSKKIWI